MPVFFKTSKAMLVIFAVFWGLLIAAPNPASLCILLAGIFTFSTTSIRQNWFFLLLIVQYCAVQLGFNLYHDGDFQTARLNDTYVLMVGACLVMMPLALHVTKDVQIWHTGLLIGLWGSLLLLFSHHFGIVGGVPVCRAYAGAFNPLLAAFLLVMFSPFIFFQWAVFGRSRRIHSIILYALIGASIIYITGSRMATYTYLLFTPFLCFYIWRQSKRLREILLFIGIITLVFILGAFVDIFSGCRNIFRIFDTLQSLEFLIKNSDQLAKYYGQGVENILTDGMPISEGARFVVWHSALDAIGAHPLTGYGQSHEGDVINLTAQSGLPHTHNQFLSWLIWGGVVSFMSGCLFLVSAILCFRTPHLPYRDKCSIGRFYPFNR